MRPERNQTVRPEPVEGSAPHVPQRRSNPQLALNKHSAILPPRHITQRRRSPWTARSRKDPQVREFALALPGAWEDHPWGESAAKVGVKVFAFFGVPGTGFGMTVKLPDSAEALLTMPFARPAGYNLGKSGWVEMHFTDDDPPPVDLLLDCVEESYRALAPKTLVRELDARDAQP